MSYSIISRPGTHLGPCLEPCQHRDCAANRATAEAICPGCGQPIGYEAKFTCDEGVPWHFTCLLNKIDKEQALAAPEPVKLDLVTARGAADILGWDRRQVAEYVKRDTFPAPAAVLQPRGRVWHRADIEAYKAEREGKRRGKEAQGDDGA